MSHEIETFLFKNHYPTSKSSRRVVILTNGLKGQVA